MTKKRCKKLLMSEGYSPRQAEDILWKVCIYDSYQDLYDWQMAPIVISRLPERLTSALLECGEALTKWGKDFKEQVLSMNFTVPSIKNEPPAD